MVAQVPHRKVHIPDELLTHSGLMRILRQLFCLTLKINYNDAILWTRMIYEKEISVVATFRSNFWTDWLECLIQLQCTNSLCTTKCTFQLELQLNLLFGRRQPLGRTLDSVKELIRVFTMVIATEYDCSTNCGLFKNHGTTTIQHVISRS